MLFIPYFNLYNAEKNKGTSFDWNEIELSEVLPSPESEVGEIHTNTTDELSIDIHKISETQYNDYLEACKELGFTVDGELIGSSYSAYNDNGFKLSLSYYKSNSEMSISVDAPMELSDIKWPQSDIAKLLPTPKSSIGHIEWEADYGFVAYIGNTPKTDYDNYVSDCDENGFNIDYNKGDNHYYADNADGYHLSLRYEGNNIMWIRIDEPDEKDNTSTEENDVITTTPNENDRYSNLKAFIDNYNAIAKTPITDVVEIDIQSPEYYKVEYRLNGFENAPAFKGEIGDCAIEIVNETFMQEPDDSMRIYIYADTLETATDVFESFCKATNPDITQDEFDEFYSYYSLDSEYGCSIVMGDISGYCNKQSDGYDILLKASPEYFN